MHRELSNVSAMTIPYDPAIAQQVVGGLILLALGGVLTSFVGRYRARVTTLRYSVWHSFFGSTITDPHLGSVEVRFGGNKVESLWYSTIRVTNDSARDITGLTLNITCDPDTHLLTARAVVSGSLNDLMLTTAYLSSAMDKKGELTSLAFTRRDFAVPVLNRGQTIEVYFLTTNTKNVQPFMTVGCDHEATRLRFAVAKPLYLGEPQQETAWIGSLMALIACWPIVVFVPSKPVAVAIAVLLGILALPVGVAVRKAFRFCIRLLG